MKRTLAIYGLLFCSLTKAQPYKGQMDINKVSGLQSHYQQEYTFDAPVDAAAWNGQPSGMQVSFASTDKRFFRTEVPTLEKTSNIFEKTAWRGERINEQVLVWSADTIQQVRFNVNDLVSAQGTILPKNNIRVNMVRYV